MEGRSFASGYLYKQENQRSGILGRDYCGRGWGEYLPNGVRAAAGNLESSSSIKESKTLSNKHTLKAEERIPKLFFKTTRSSIEPRLTRS